MPRALPWLKSTSDTAAQSRKPAKTETSRPKRRRVLEPSSDIDVPSVDQPSKQNSARNVDPPINAPEPPSESFMKEGLDGDDKFRMVEDEFLDAAKQFTQHLHAAEYQRIKKDARSQKASTINSILRPVTIKMPEETRRKVESVARSKKQARTLQGLLGSEGQDSGADEDSDQHDNAWLGTALHGLMEGPRRTNTFLTRVADTSSSTRAAAGFRRPRQPSAAKSSSRSSPPAVARERKDPTSARDATDSEVDDDDLDAPVQVVSNAMARRIHVPTAEPRSHMKQFSPTFGRNMKSNMPVSKANSLKFEEDLLDEGSSRPATTGRERIAQRLEQAKIRQIKKDEEACKQKLGVIPTFLS